MNRADKRRATRPLRLGILTATWGRSLLTEHVMRHYLAINIPHVELVPLAVWSEEDLDPPVDVDGWHYVERPNQPLGKKWNAGMRALLRLDVDAVMVIGSDDLVSASYIRLAVGQMRRGAHEVAVRDLYIYVPPMDVVASCASMVPGAGRVVTRHAMDELRGKLWDDDARAYLDSSAMSRLRQIRMKRHIARDMAARDFAVLDIKLDGGPNMWTFIPGVDSRTARLRNTHGTELQIRRAIYIPAGQFFRDYFPHVTRYEALGSGDAYAA